MYQLAGLPIAMDIVVGLRGRYKLSWDEQMRPIPKNSRLIRLEEALECQSPYLCVITHNITDLMDVKTLACPRLMVIHSTLEGRKAEEGSGIPPARFAATVRDYLKMVGAHAVPCSLLKGRSWGITGDIVPFSVDVEEYLPHIGQEGAGLRICNHIQNRRKILLWDFHEEAFGELPVRLVGHNPGIPGVAAARNWAELKGLLQTHRFFIHTADPRYEDGYNMATLEAMAAGLPVLGNRHPSSPITDGVDGFLSDDPVELRNRAVQLLSDSDLAWRMGQEARKRVRARFPKEAFHRRFARSIQRARLAWKTFLQNKGLNPPF